MLGLTNTSFLLYKSSSDFSTYNYPYSYLPLYLETTKKDFYLDIFDYVSGEMGINFSECDVIVTALLDSKVGDYPLKSSKLLSDVLPVVVDYSYVFVDQCSLIYGNSYIHATPRFDFSPVLKLNEPEKINAYANSMMYNNYHPQKDFDIFDRDDVVRALFNEISKTVEAPKQKIIFSGDRFAGNINLKSLAFLLAIDLVKQPGFYELYIDRDNVLGCAAHIADYEKDASSIVSSLKLEFAGNLLNSPGGVECLVKTSVGTTQMIDLHVETIQVVPMERDASSTIYVKHQGLGSLEKSVQGGDMGLLIDTRLKDLQTQVIDSETRHKKYREWQHLLEESLAEL